MKNWKLDLYYAALIALALSPASYILAREWGKRACADPNAWQQKSFGRAIAECKARGGRPYSSDYDGTIECVRRTEIAP